MKDLKNSKTEIAMEKYMQVLFFHPVSII